MWYTASTMNNTYELTYIISDQFSEAEVLKHVAEVKKLLPNGKLIEEKAWGKRDLAYPIKKQKAGYYFTFIFQSEPSALHSLNQKLKLQEGVLRYLIVKTELPKEKMAEKKTEKPEPKAEAKTEEKPKKRKPAQKELKVKKAKLTTELEKEAEQMKVLEEKLKEILKE